MTAPTVTEITPTPQPVVPDPFIDDVSPPSPPLPVSERRRIFD